MNPSWMETSLKVQYLGHLHSDILSQVLTTNKNLFVKYTLLISTNISFLRACVNCSFISYYSCSLLKKTGCKKWPRKKQKGFYFCQPSGNSARMSGAGTSLAQKHTGPFCDKRMMRKACDLGKYEGEKKIICCAVIGKENLKHRKKQTASDSLDKTCKRREVSSPQFNVKQE